MTYGNLIGSAGNGVQYFNGSQFSTVDNDHTGNSECPKNYDNGLVLYIISHTVLS